MTRQLFNLFGQTVKSRCSLRPDVSVNLRFANKRGEEYLLDSEEEGGFLYLKVFHKKIPVGYCNCIFQGNEMNIADLRIRDDVLQPQGQALGLLRSLIPCWKRKTINYWNRGLGSTLLDCVISSARQKNVKSITAHVTKEDLSKTPHLLDFYRKLGFTVFEQREGKEAARLVMELGAND